MFRCLTILLFFSLCACSGYQLGGAKPKVFKQIKSITIPHFKNNTQTPRVSSLVTNSTVDAFAQDGTYAIRSNSTADATLRGTIKEIKYLQFRASRFDTLASDELRVNLIVDWELVQNGVVIGKGTATGSTTFNAEDNLSISRQNALPLASSRAAQHIVSQLSEGF